MTSIKKRALNVLQDEEGQASETESNNQEGTDQMNTSNIVPATTVTDQGDLDAWDQTFPCESFDWCEGHDAWDLKHTPAERIHMGEDKKIWHETTAEANMMDFDVLAQRMRIGINGADTIAISFQIDGRLSMLELPGFAFALESTAAKFRAIAAEVA